MHRSLVLAAAFALILSGAADAKAKQCRDHKGKFMKCAASAPASTKCRDAKTKQFAKCGTAGAIPATK